MSKSATYLSYSETGYFSRIVCDYVSGEKFLQTFYSFPATVDGIANAISQRSKYHLNRQLLFDVITRQYTSHQKHEKLVTNIELLRSENTFTICTAHQPNLLTGYLYFVYKILHAIKMAEELKKLHPGKNFVPVYYMGSEDNDLEELGTFHFNDKKYIWDGGGQKGAVGKMSTTSLEPLLHELFTSFGPPGSNCDELISILTNAYLQHENISDATQYLVNELFGRYGLIVLNPDDKDLKKAFVPIMEDELLHQNAFNIVSEQIKKLAVNYKAQAQPRPINLFYLEDQLRERIEMKGNEWHVMNTNIVWSRKQMLQELHDFPERFSPNVILRGLFQESILPNIAFIGGGAELAYWLQLKPLFGHYNVFYPALFLRQSVLWVQGKQNTDRGNLGISIADLFKTEDILVKEYLEKNSEGDWHTAKEALQIEQIFEGLKGKAVAFDSTLLSSAEASKVKMLHLLQSLEKKMLRAEKRKMQVQLSQINKLKNALFPNNSLQERVDNFMQYYLLYGPSFFDNVKDDILPFDQQFLVMEQ